MAEKPSGVWLCSIILISIFIIFALFFLLALVSGPDFIYSMGPELEIDSAEDIETVWQIFIVISGLFSVLYLVNGILLLKAKPIARPLSMVTGVLLLLGGGFLGLFGGIAILYYVFFDKKTKEYLKTE